MQHPINPLNDAGLDMLCDRLTDFTVAYENLSLDGCLERVERILPLDLFNELRAYLGSMRDHVSVVTELLYGDTGLLANDGLVEPFNPSVAAYKAAIDEFYESYQADDAPPHGYERPAIAEMTREQVEIHERLWGHIAPTSPDDHVEAIATMLATAASTPDSALKRYFAQLDRGVITSDEFDALVVNYWTERGMNDADDTERVQWMYDHDLLDAEQFHGALAECWVEHVATVLAAGDHPDNVSNCGMCACGSAHEYVNAYLTARYPQMTGAPAVCEEGTPG